MSDSSWPSLGTLVQLFRCEPSANGWTQASETALSMKEEVRPYYVDSILFSPRTPVGFVGDSFDNCSVVQLDVNTWRSWVGISSRGSQSVLAGL